MRRDLPSGTVTFLFTDVEGSTRLLHGLGAESYAEALADHRRLIREACAAEGGDEVDTQGDAFFFAFPTAPGALAAAAAFTEALASGPISVRVGLHTGTPLLAEEGYVGDDVHFAARVMSAAHGGQVVLSSATASLVEPPLTDLGEHRLKDIEHAVPLFQLGDVSFPPLKTISNTNLPRPASSFLGREAELAEVLSGIDAGARLVTLTGPGGTGKTRLALEAATSLVPEYTAGVFWVGLASLRDPALVTETIAQTLGAKDSLAFHIAEREMLLLLDNLEQVIECAPELSELLRACPNLTLLVTSRELLRIQGEVEHPVPPLASSEAVELFCARSQLEPSDEVTELCARLDSLPLAVELAAARTRALTPAQILERLSQRLDLLKGGRDADPRQQTLRATIEWSYDLLSSEEQQLFARLSVFAGGCTLDAAEGVCDAELDTLQSLVEKSLLRFTPSNAGGRYWMLETVREYALERLESKGTEKELQRRHASWCLELSRAAEVEWTLPTAPQWLRRIEDELGNIRAAFRWASSHDQTLALSLIANTWFFWSSTGRSLEERRLLEEAWTERAPVDVRKRALRALAAAALNQNDIAVLVSTSQARLELARLSGDLTEEAAAMNMLAVGATLDGDATAARKWFDGAISILRRTSDESGLMTTLANYAHLEREEGNLARARELSRENLVLARRGASEPDIMWALKELGMIAVEEGAHEVARACLSEALLISSRVGAVDLAHDLLHAVATILASTEHPHDGAVLVGAIEAMDERSGFVVLGNDVRWWSLRSELTEVVGQLEFEHATLQGRSLDHDAAIRFALSCLD